MAVRVSFVWGAIAMLALSGRSVLAAPKQPDGARTCKFSISGRTDPDATISGKLVRRMVWGPPNYGENPKTDAQYHAWFVVLDDPVRVMTGPDLEAPPKLTIAREIQIRWADGQGSYFKYGNTHVVVRGKLFTQVFPGDHTPVVIEASALGSGPAIHCPH
jgi:hypothetical protein